MPSIEYNGQEHHYASTGDGVDAFQIDRQRVANGQKPLFSHRALKGRSQRKALRDYRKAMRQGQKRGISSNGH